MLFLDLKVMVIKSFNMNQQCVLESKAANSVFECISKNAASRSKAAILLLYSALVKSGALCLVLDLPVHERHTEVSLVKGHQDVFGAGDDDVQRGTFIGML